MARNLVGVATVAIERIGTEMELTLEIQRPKSTRRKEKNLVERELIRWLADGIEASLCTFCNHSEPNGSCGETYYECHHPLEYKLPSCDEELCPGGDCWGFLRRTDMSISDIADLWGIIKSKGWKNWFLIVNGDIKIYEMRY